MSDSGKTISNVLLPLISIVFKTNKDGAFDGTLESRSLRQACAVRHEDSPNDFLSLKPKGLGLLPPGQETSSSQATAQHFPGCSYFFLGRLRKSNVSCHNKKSATKMLTLTTGKRKWGGAKLEENCELRGNVQRQKNIRRYFHSQKLRTIPGYSSVLAGEYWSRDALRPIAHEQKYLMDYKRW